MATPNRFDRVGWVMVIVAASVPALGGCSRVSTPAPAPPSDAASTLPAVNVPSALPASDAGSAPRASDAASATPQTSVSAPARADSPPVASASATATPASSGAKESDCARRAEASGLSADDRARSRATCEAKEEMRAFVAARQSCSSATDCTNLGGSCPFGCFVPVAKRSAPEVTAKLEELGSRLDKAGNRCTYRCMGAPAAACVAGRCTAGTP